ncbi:MAG: YncE family protein [Acidobacteria bacterium]|nr:MAG: YncE family protein [Acidobacteriota bacterium]
MPRNSSRIVFAAAALAAALPIAAAPPTSETADLHPPTREYFAYVCAESEDEVSLVSFGPQGTAVVKTIEVGTFPAEIEGPHGINVSPSGRHWFVSMSHGQPFGTIHKYRTGSDEWEGDVRVGMFPATLDVAATTGLLYVVNSDFYGEHLPSTISVVATATMTEVEQIDTGTMPHGARLSRDGHSFYSVNMMDDELVEVDALRFEIRRRLKLSADGGGADPAHSHHGAAAHRMGHAMRGGAAHHAPGVEPAWVSEPTAQGKVYVTGLSSHRIYEVDLESWTVSRSFDTAAAGADGHGPYNLAVTPDGRRLVATYKKGDAVGFWDLGTGRELTRIATTRRIPHGVAITADGRYAFVTVEGVGGEPGVVEVYDTVALQRVGEIEIGKQAGGIAVWEPRGKSRP